MSYLDLSAQDFNPFNNQSFESAKELTLNPNHNPFNPNEMLNLSSEKGLNDKVLIKEN
jgi:hypothetical protein